MTSPEILDHEPSHDDAPRPSPLAPRPSPPSPRPSPPAPPPFPCGIALPQDTLTAPAEMEGIGRFAARAEALGYAGLWVAEEILGGAPALDPITLLAYVAGQTQRVRLGIGVIVLSTRNPIHLAKSLASLDFMSQGRLEVGVGIGRAGLEGAFGGSGERRVQRFEESLGVMQALWAQSNADFAGEFWSFRGQTLWPKPVQQPHPPLWFGGFAPAALRRAVQYGDGFMGAGIVSTAQFATQCRLLRQYLEEAERPREQFRISKRVHLAIDAKPGRAERRMRGWFGIHFGNPDLAEEAAIWGSREACLEQLQQVIQAGADHLVLAPMYHEHEHLELLAAEIIPALAPAG